VLLNTLNDFYTPFDVIVLLDGKVTVLILEDLINQWSWDDPRNKTSNLNFTLGPCMGKRAIMILVSLFNKYQRRANLITLLVTILGPGIKAHHQSFEF
jgi:hypothetical protein